MKDYTGYEHSYRGYQNTAVCLKDRIKNLIPKHPEILQMVDPSKLFKLKDFKCDDLNPSLAQACAALSVAKNEFLKGEA